MNLGYEKNKIKESVDGSFNFSSLSGTTRKRNSEPKVLDSNDSSNTYKSGERGIMVAKTTGIKKKAIIHGIIWSLSYWIVMLTSGLWWHNYTLFNLYRSVAPIIWFPYTFWAWFLASVTSWGSDNFILMWCMTILAVPTSILIVYVVLKTWEVIK